MIRPEAAKALHRWRDAGIGLAFVALGTWWLGGTGLMPYLGAVVALGGLALTVVGIQRARFARGGGGAGIVAVDERLVTYMGPLTGGAIALDELRRLDLDPTAHPDPVWVLTGREDTIHVPVTAEGADTLFDAFAALPGLETGRMLNELSKGGRAVVSIWERPEEREARARLTLH